VPLGESTVLEHALGGIRRAATSMRVVAVVPEDRMREAEAIARRVYGDDATAFVSIAPGGPTRAASVAHGLEALDAAADVVLVHDAARALTPPELFDAVAAAVLDGGRGVVPVLPIADTIKRVDPDGGVIETVDRDALAAAQTPQGFPAGVLVTAYRELGDAASTHTDDASLVAAAGHPVVTIRGSELAFKITTPADLERAEAALGLRAARAVAQVETRTGVGVDAHAFDPGRPLWLGGVLWPEARAGLAGHSDGDAASHALVDALLTAAGLGDIGSRFGTDDARYTGASGAVFLRETVEALARDGWRVRSAAVEIIANEPRIAPRRGEMQAALSAVVGAPVSVAGTTSDGLGITGRGEGVAAVATALIERDGSRPPRP